MHSSAQKSATSLSQLVFIDMQTRLSAVMPTDPVQSVIKYSRILAQSAELLDVPVLITEQYPKGLGNTLPELAESLQQAAVIEKTAFSCLAEPRFERHLTRDRSQIILAGMEAHICVLQTALDLVASGKQVFVVEDAVISRNPAHKSNAISRMREAGCIITNTESVVFEWLGKAEGDVFKAISKLIR